MYIKRLGTYGLYTLMAVLSAVAVYKPIWEARQPTTTINAVILNTEPQVQGDVHLLEGGNKITFKIPSTGEIRTGLVKGEFKPGDNLEIVVRDSFGNPLDTYKPKELHQFDLNNGKIIAEASLNGSKIFT